MFAEDSIDEAEVVQYYFFDRAGNIVEKGKK